MNRKIRTWLMWGMGSVLALVGLGYLALILLVAACAPYDCP
jgi:hypothetical protein